MTGNWMDEEAERIQTKTLKDLATAEKERELESTISWIWKSTSNDIYNEVAAFNQNTVLKEKYGRSIQYSPDGWGNFRMSSDIFPAIDLSVNRNGSCVSVDWSVATPTQLEKWSQNPYVNAKLIKREKYAEKLQLVVMNENELMFDGINGREPITRFPEYVIRKFLIEPTRHSRM